MKLGLSFLAIAGLSEGATLCANTESATCPCAHIRWKKAKIGGNSASKIQKRGQSSVEMRVAIVNQILDKDASKYPDSYQADWTFRHPTYGKNSGNANVLTGSCCGVESPKRYNPNFHVFVQWSRKKCGVDFLNAIDNGDVTFDAMDNYDVYNTRDMKTYYNKWVNDPGMNKNYWTSIIQFKSENAEEDGHTLNGKTAVDDGNWKKDLLYLWIYGLDKVGSWKGGDMDACLHSAYISVLEIGEGFSDPDADYTQCVAESNVLW